MQITIEVPEIKCVRCGKVEPIRPQILRHVAHVQDGVMAKDSAQGVWTAQGQAKPAGWTAAPAGSGEYCPECTKAFNDHLQNFDKPVSVESPPAHLASAGVTKTQATPVRAQHANAIPTRVMPAPTNVRTQSAPSRPPVVRSVAPSVQHTAAPQSRPQPIAVATLPKVVPSTVQKTATYVGTHIAVTSTPQVVTTSKIRQAIAPAMAAKPEPAQVIYPSTEPTKVSPSPVHVEKEEFPVHKLVEGK
jgi:hypothetical protein